MLDSVEVLLESEKIYKRGWSLKQLFTNVAHYVRSRLYFDSVDGEVELDPVTGLPKKFRGKFTFRNLPISERMPSIIAIDDVLQQCNNSLVASDQKIWLLFDRLDVMFSTDRDAERMALRALMRVYGSLRALPALCPKIFLRNDIWRAITKDDGYREASHFAPVMVDLSWSKTALADMLLMRFLRSQAFRDYYGKDKKFMRKNSNDRMNFLISLFPHQMNMYDEKPKKAFV